MQIVVVLCCVIKLKLYDSNLYSTMYEMQGKAEKFNLSHFFATLFLSLTKSSEHFSFVFFVVASFTQYHLLFFKT